MDFFVLNKHFPFLSAFLLEFLSLCFYFDSLGTLFVLSFLVNINWCLVLLISSLKLPEKSKACTHFGCCTLIGPDRCHAHHGQPLLDLSKSKWRDNPLVVATGPPLSISRDGSWPLAHPLSHGGLWLVDHPLSLIGIIHTRGAPPLSLKSSTPSLCEITEVPSGH
jgi:hypothetical protein